MKSVKPGRGESKKGFVGSAAAALFGIFWCVAAGAMGAWFMIPFGLIFVGVAVYNAIYDYTNATSEDRFSIVDIVDSDEEPDPLNEYYGRKKSFSEMTSEANAPGTSVAFCPYCGQSVEGAFEFCPKCGEKLPD